MATPGIPGLDVIEESSMRSVANRPYKPNFTMPPGAPPAPANAVATRPYQPNFTMPPGTGARQPFNVEAPARAVSPPGGVEDATIRRPGMRERVSRAVGKLPASVQTTGKLLMRGGAGLAAASAIGDSMAEDSTARYAKRFGVDEPTGDGSVGDILKFVGLRAGGFASDLGNTLTGGLAGKLYADQPGAMPAAPATPTAAPAFPPNSQGQPGGTVPGTGVTPPNPAGTIRRVGNSYSGENIKFGADIADPRNPGAGVSSLPSEGFRQDQMELARMRASAPQGPTLGGFDTTEQVGMARTGGTATFGPSLSVLGPSGTQRPRDIRAANALAAERGIAADRIAAEQGNARMRESGDMARANLSAGVQREGFDVQRDNNAATLSATMRGQDITHQGHLISAAGQRAQMMRDQFNKDREFDAGRGDKALEQRSARETQLQKNLEAANTVMDSDGKPQVDARAVTEMRRGIDRAVARMGISGPHELGPQAEQQLIAASSLLKTMQENAGYLPWKPDKLKTIDPYDLTGLKVLPNGDRQITRPGQALGQIIPGRFFRTEEGARFFGGTPTNRYDMLGTK